MKLSKKGLILLIIFLFVFVSGCDNPKKNTIIEENSETYVPSDSTPFEHNIFDNIKYMNNKFKSQNAFYSTTTGTVNSKVLFINYEQEVKSQRVLNNGMIYTKYSSYSSLKKAAEECLFVNNKAYIHPSEKISSIDDISWKDECNILEMDKYLDEYGTSPFNICGYIINEETIKSYEILEDGEKYKFNLSLDATLAVHNYAIEMKKVSDATDYPTFKNVLLTITINNNWEVEEIKATEEYDISIAIIGTVSCFGELVQVFNYDTLEITSLEFFNDYM